MLQYKWESLVQKFTQQKKMRSKNSNDNQKDCSTHSTYPSGNSYPPIRPGPPILGCWNASRFLKEKKKLLHKNTINSMSNSQKYACKHVDIGHRCLFNLLRAKSPGTNPILSNHEP